jgi:hypothetical protein
MDNAADSATGQCQCKGQISDCGTLVCQNQLLHSCCILFHPRCAGSTGAIVNTVHVRSTIPALSAPFPDVLCCNSVITTQLYQLIVNFTGADTFCQLNLNHTTNYKLQTALLDQALCHYSCTSTYPLTDSCAICRTLPQLQVLPTPNIK